MGVKFADKAATTITGDIAADATSVTVASVSGFPTITGAGDYFYATIERKNDTTTYEVVKVTNLSSTTYTIDRSVESSFTFSANDVFALRLNEHALVDPTLLDDAGITLSDNKKITLGTGGDLEIYHDGSNSIITDAGEGTGDLLLRGNNLKLQKADGAEDYLIATMNGSVAIKHDNATKLETASGGIDVTGEVKGDTLNIDGAASIAGAITDVTTLTASGEIEGGSLDINGAASIAGAVTDVTTLTASGEIEGGSLDINGAVDVATSNSVFKVDTGSSNVLFTATDTSGQFIIENTTDDANGAPDLHLRRTVGTPADSDVVGSVVAEGKAVNSDGTLSDYLYFSRLITTLTDSGGTVGNSGASDGSYAAKLDIQVSKAGAPSATIQSLTPDLVTFNKPITVTGTVTADKIIVGDNSSEETQLQITNGSAGIEINQSQDSTGTVIKETGAGDLTFKADNFYLQHNGESTNRLSFTDTTLKLYDGAGNEVLATVTGGIDVTGEVKGDSLDIDGAVDVNTSNGNVDFNIGSGIFTIASTNTSDQLLLTNTNTGSGLDGAPDIVLRNLYTNVSEIVDNNVLGTLHFGGNTLNVAGDALSGSVENFGRILCLSNDVTTGTHDGILDFKVASAGTTATRMQVKPEGIDVTGTVTADGATFDVGENKVVISGTGQGTGLRMTSSESASQACPDLILERSANGTSSGENIGAIHFDGVNAGSSIETFAQIFGRASDYTAGDEDGLILLRPSVAGTLTTILEVDKNGIDVTGKITASSSGIADNDVAVYGSGVADDDFLRINGTDVEGRSAADVLSDIGAVAASGDTTIAGVKTFSGSISGHITTTVSDGDQANLENFYGQRIIHTGDAHTYTLAATGSISGSAIGKSIIIINGGTDTITINVTTSEFFNMVAGVDPDYDDSDSGGASSVTVLKGGAAELIVTETNKILVFGSGVI